MENPKSHGLSCAPLESLLGGRSLVSDNLSTKKKKPLEKTWKIPWHIPSYLPIYPMTYPALKPRLGRPAGELVVELMLLAGELGTEAGEAGRSAWVAAGLGLVRLGKINPWSIHGKSMVKPCVHSQVLFIWGSGFHPIPLVWGEQSSKRNTHTRQKEEQAESMSVLVDSEWSLSARKGMQDANLC